MGGGKMDWEELLVFLRNNVPSGNVTTFGNLAEVFFGGPGAGPAIAAMLNAAVRDDDPNNNRTWTNRVVNAQGEIQVPGQLEQLQNEGIIIQGNGKVNFHQCPPMSFDVVDDPPLPEPPGHPEPVPPTNTTAFDTFQHIINYQEHQGTEELRTILANTSYEIGSFANTIKYHLGEKLGTFLNKQGVDLFTLIKLVKDAEQMSDNAIDLAHTIRKQRNQIIYQKVPVETYHARNCLVLIAAFLLWPQLPN